MNISYKFFLLILCCIHSLPLFSQQTNGSSISSVTYLEADGSRKLINNVYDNGLGDVIQETQVGITPLHNDLIVHHDYDSQRRKVNSWLPSVNSSNGEYVARNTVVSAAITQYGDAEPYAKSEYESLLFYRPSKNIAPGSTRHVQGIGQNHSYYTTTCLGLTAVVSGTVFLNSRMKYLVVETTDEDGCISNEYTSEKGTRLITETSAGKTYFVYNYNGDICYIIPPCLAEYVEREYYSRGAMYFYDTDSQFQKYAYIYRYDNQRHCIYKKLPGCEPIYYIYDKAGNCILSQDGNQRTRGEWTYTIPDRLGRPCISGVCHNSVSYSSRPYRYAHIYANYDGTTASTKGYAVNNISLTEQTLLSAIYYDNYSFIGQSGVSSLLSASSADGGTIDNSIQRGHQTGAATAYTDATGVVGYNYTAMYYDSHHRVTQTRSTNHMGGVDVESIWYSYSSKPMSRRLAHYVNGGNGFTETYNYTYDHADRLTDIKHVSGYGNEVTLAHNQYDELGQLSSSRRLNGNGIVTSYIYDNLHSTLTGINAPGLFSESLYYEESHNDNIPCYNGNISALEWKAGDMALSRGYNFSYDNTSRLVNASYRENGGSSNKYSVEYEYNSMGSITSLRRNGLQDGGTYGRIDNLTMTYDGNRLVKVSDSVTDPTYNGAWNFADHANADIEYEYDGNGNVTKDLNRKILSIQYNSLNLPSLITFNDMSTTSYTYSADGTKLRAVYHTNLLDEEVEEDGVAEEADGEEEEVIEEYDYAEDEEEVSVDCFATKTIDYVGNCIYEDGVLKQMLFDGGFVTYPNGNATGSPTYHFYLQDHLGNNRVVVNESGSVEQVNHYYPYGGLMAESTGGDMQRYKYNGKELDRMHGLDWHDYGARWFNNDAVFWMTMDPLCEKYPDVSPYVYCVSNPMIFFDPDGKDGVISIYGSAITISANVYLYGNGATNAVLHQMQNDINRVWGRKHSVNHNGKSYSVNFNISLSLYGGQEKNDPYIIADSWNPFSRNNYIEVSDDCQRSKVIRGDEGIWRSVGRNGKSLSQDDPAPHEVGHLLGLPDQYTNGNIPNKGWETNIMGDCVNGSVDNRNINDILQDAWLEYDKWIKEGNKGEFKYEINP